MLNQTTLAYTKHKERGYCYDHPLVIDQTKSQVVDRAVKQLLTALQSNGFELDGNILKRGNGWLQYAAGTSTWQYSNDAGVTWTDIGSGGDPRLAVSEDVDGIILTLSDGVPAGQSAQMRINKATGFLEAWNPDYEQWDALTQLAELAQHLSSTTAHNKFASDMVSYLAADTTLTVAQVVTNRMLIVTAPCTLALPSNFNACRVSIWARGVEVNLKAHEDPMWGSTILLPGTAAPGVYQIHNSSPAQGDCIVLRGLTNGGDIWLCESLIGAWAGV